MQICSQCQQTQPEINRFCTQCGHSFDMGRSEKPVSEADKPDQLNIHILYGMVVMLIVALVVPPWETSPEQAPEFLGMHFILSPPDPEAIVSRMLLTIELVTIAIAGMYGAFLFRKKS